jgi:hypothetical protein
MVSGIGSSGGVDWARYTRHRQAHGQNPPTDPTDANSQHRGTARVQGTARPETAKDRAEHGSLAPGGPGDPAANDHAESATGELTPEEQREVDELRARDLEVRSHEAAHMAAGGAHIRGGASYTYQQGPDGKLYAVGGEVGIDTSSVPGNPQATIAKMQQIRAAALAASEPSGADRSVAAKASQIEARARQDLTRQAAEKFSQSGQVPKSGEVAAGSLLEAAA